MSATVEGERYVMHDETTHTGIGAPNADNEHSEVELDKVRTFDVAPFRLMKPSNCISPRVS